MNNLFQIFDNTADGVFIINEGRRIIYWNKAAQEILGYTPDEVIGQSCYKIMGGCDDKGQVLCHHRCNVSLTAFAGKTVSNYDLATHTKSGEMCWINVSILTILSGNNGSTPVIIHLFRDTTKTKQNEQFIHHMFEAIEHWQKTAASPISPAPVEPHIESLTGRESEVLSLLAHGASTANIAETLSISPATVRNHIQKILHKLHVHSRLEAVAYAFEHGLVRENKTKD